MLLLHKLRKIISRKAKFQLAALLVGIIFGAFLEMLALSIISPFISVLLDSGMIEANPALSYIYQLFGFPSTAHFLAFLAFALAFVYIFRGGYMLLLNKMQFGFIAWQQIILSNQILRKVLYKPYLYHAGKNLAEMQRMATQDVSLFFALVQSMLFILNDFFMTGFILVFLLIVSVPMTLSVLALSGICVFVHLKFFRKKIRQAGEENRLRSIAMSKALNESWGAIKDLKILQREEHFLKVFKTAGDGVAISSQRASVLNGLPRMFIETVCFGGAFILIGLMILRGTNMQQIVPQLSLFVLAAFRMLPAVARLNNGVGQIIFYRSSLDAVYKSLFEEDMPEVNTEEPSEAAAVAGNEIKAVNLSFTYPNAAGPVLEHVSFTIKEGDSVAFTGPSGAGKTTLVDIILGIYAPSQGYVAYDGYSVHHHRDKWCAKLGYIPQSIYLLDDTITSNVAFGIDKEEVSYADVWRALEQAQMKDFVESLPDGLDTIVGDRGVRLSGGQRQRIGIARALYDDPPILVLDEATSSLDDGTEKAVMEAVNSFQGKKTMLIVAHRLSTIQNCDVVYEVRDKGVFLSSLPR